MKRLSGDDVISIALCPVCGKGGLENSPAGIVCVSCTARFSVFRDHPVLLREDNELFPASAYIDVGAGLSPRSGRLSKLKKMLPGKSVNVARTKMFSRLADKYRGKQKMILVIGCGNQTAQLQRYFGGDDTSFVFCDIDKNADVDIFCDSHELAFRNCVFDGVITTAVLEHVLYPRKVVAEIVRVLKPNGFIYSEIPFLQSVHEGAYDFTRFSMSGHRLLLNNFKEIDSGIVGGPGTALVWSLVDFFRALSSNARISSLLGMFARAVFFWLKYFDYITKDNHSALNAASGTYFYGAKLVNTVSAANIISRYSGTKIEHI
jgi:SAM-dependent methyltransferase